MLTALDKRCCARSPVYRAIPGAFNIRKTVRALNAARFRGSRSSRKREPGIDIIVKPGITGTVHIPVIITATGLTDLVYNTIEIGAGADILLVAGAAFTTPATERRATTVFMKFCASRRPPALPGETLR